MLSIPEGAAVKKGDVIARWDPYNIPVLSEREGTVAFKDMIPGVTVKRELDESTGRIATRNEIRRGTPADLDDTGLGGRDFRGMVSGCRTGAEQC